MRAVLAALASALPLALVVAAPAVTHAEPHGPHASAPATSEGTHVPTPTPGAAPVIGGADAPAGKWPDVAAVNFAGQQGCTGTLIAPTVVLTAGHCNGTDLDSVIIGTSSLARAAEGETITVAKRIEYPSSQTTIDVTALVLSRASTREPRKIATGWASLEIKNGASIQIVGYGAVDRNGPVPFNMDEQYVNELQEATTAITDADCTINAANGCNAAAKPAGELGAGGMGIDTCPGDSGGPVYLPTPFGTFLAGVTSRSYDDAMFWCSEGGIYARPDKVADWIEKETGVPIGRGPEPTYAPLSAVRGNAAETQITANDPRSEGHTFAITTAPKFGKAAIKDDGSVRVCTDPGVAGEDSMVVTITDTTDATRALAIKLPITILDGAAGSGCDPNDFGGDGGGCCDAGRSAGGSIPLGLGVVALVLRRRRRRA